MTEPISLEMIGHTLKAILNQQKEFDQRLTEMDSKLSGVHNDLQTIIHRLDAQWSTIVPMKHKIAGQHLQFADHEARILHLEGDLPEE